jgi:hypothetical protein
MKKATAVDRSVRAGTQEYLCDLDPQSLYGKVCKINTPLTNKLKTDKL